jgi:hypothetical protein
LTSNIIRINNPAIKNESEIVIGIVLSSFSEASISTINSFFLNVKKRIIGAAKPRTAATNIVTIAFVCSVSKWSANIKNIIKVNDGGTRSSEIIRAILSLFKFHF